jgi:hyperosmotically inducible protein
MNRTKLSIITLLSIVALSAAAQGNLRRSEGRYDQQIQRQVAEELQKKERLRGITVTVEDAIVTLSGRVTLYIDKVNAESRVRKIKNLDGIRNHITVETTPVENAELRETLADRLRYHRAGYGALFNNVTVGVENGVVTIGGKMRDYPDRDSAIAIVETTPGVKDVIDELDVAPLSKADDELRMRLARAVYGHASLRKYGLDPQAPIRIVVENGHVELSGVVNSKGDRQIVYTQVKFVPGVFSVTNRLIVAPR